MKDDRLNRWLTHAANLGVLVGLLILVLEIQTNTAAIHAASVQEITTGTREALMAVATDGELSRIVRVGDLGGSVSDLDEDEAFRYLLFSRQRWVFFQGVWTQRRLGVLDDQVWGAYLSSICLTGGTEEWSNHTGVLDPEFVEMVEACAN